MRKPLRGPAPTERTRMMVEAYQAGGVLHEVAEQFGVSRQRVHQAIRRHAPEAMRPKTVTRFRSVGPPGHELYRVGSCKKCEVALFAYRPVSRELCGHCEAIAEAAA